MKKWESINTRTQAIRILACLGPSCFTIKNLVDRFDAKMQIRPVKTDRLLRSQGPSVDEVGVWNGDREPMSSGEENKEEMGA
jgi:hypothetical protein